MKKMFIGLLISLFFMSPVYADNDIVNVSYVGEVTTASGTAPDLPSQAKVQFSNGSEKDYNIVWNSYDENLYKTRNASQFNVSGSIQELQYTTNCIVVVEAAKVTHIDELPSQTVMVGTTLSLPATVKVTWSNGDQTQENIQWNHYNRNALDHVQTLSLTGQVVNQTITQLVYVKSASIISVSVPAVVSTKVGEAAQLPQYATVTYSNKATKRVPVVWNNKVFDRAGKYIVSGHLSHSTRTVSIHVEVEENQVTKEETKKTVKKVKKVKKTKKKKSVENKSSISYIMALIMVMIIVIGSFMFISFISKKIRIKENR